jgi:hypothetical protein
LDRHHLRVLIYQAHPLLYFSRKSRRATFLRFWSFTLIRMSASSSAGGSSFPPTRDPAQRLPIPRPAIRPKHNRTCRCSQCYLRPSLFPRGDRGQIELPRPTWLESSSTGMLVHSLGPASSSCFLQDRRAWNYPGQCLEAKAATRVGKGRSGR